MAHNATQLATPLVTCTPNLFTSQSLNQFSSLIGKALGDVQSAYRVQDKSTRVHSDGVLPGVRLVTSTSPVMTSLRVHMWVTHNVLKVYGVIWRQQLFYSYTEQCYKKTNKGFNCYSAYTFVVYTHSFLCKLLDF